MLCKVIRSHSSNSNCGEPRIFVSNLLPKVTGSPLRSPVWTSNFTLQQAVRSVGHAMGRVFELSMYEHLISKNHKIIKPISKYFVVDGSLSRFGCLIFRECLMRETVVKTYWFAHEGV